MDTPTVFLVDDDPGIRKSFMFLLESKGFRVETFESAAIFLEQLDCDRPGCLVLDVRMPGMNGLELQQVLVEKSFPLPIILVSAHADLRMASQAFRSGALEVLEKPVKNQYLIERILEAIEIDASRRAGKQPDPMLAKRIDRLSPKEREALDCLLKGYSIKQIASEFNVSNQTAAKHRARVLDKMEVENEVQLIRLVEQISEKKSET